MNTGTFEMRVVTLINMTIVCDSGSLLFNHLYDNETASERLIHI